MTVELTDKFIEDLPLAKTPEAIARGYEGDSYTIGDSNVQGLAIKIGLKRKVWQVAVRPYGGATVKEKLGDYDQKILGIDPRTKRQTYFRLKVASARENGSNRIAALREGRRPAAEKRDSIRKAEAERRETLNWLLTKYGEERVKKAADGKPKKNSLRGFKTARFHLADWLDTPFREITHDMVSERFKKISSEMNKQGKPKLTTANNVFRDLRTVFNNWISKNLVSGLRNPTETLARERHKTEPRTNWINTRKEGAQFVRWWNSVEEEKNETIRDYLKITLFQGARETETAQLEWKHLDFVKKTITYFETKNGKTYIFPMTPKVHDILLARWEDEGRHEKWVFPATRIRQAGKTLNHISVPPAKAVKRISTSAEVNWTMHDLRRTYSNTLLHLGIEQRERDYMMKHEVKHVAVHYEDLAITLAENLETYENHLLSLLLTSKDKEGG